MSSLAFQPFPRIFGAQSDLVGGNAMGLTTGDKNRFVVEMNQLWFNGKYDADALEIGKQFQAALEAQKAQIMTTASATNASLETYTPFYMNDAADDTAVLASYKKYDQFKALQREMDPEGLWLRSGGAAGWRY
jgi:hypothetical protein